MFAHTFRFAERNFRCVEGKHDLIQVPVTLRLQEETAQIQLKLSPSNWFQRRLLYFGYVEAKLQRLRPGDYQQRFDRRISASGQTILCRRRCYSFIGHFDSHLAWFVPFWPDHDRRLQTCQRTDLAFGVGSGQNFGQVSRPNCTTPVCSVYNFGRLWHSRRGHKVGYMFRSCRAAKRTTTTKNQKCLPIMGTKLGGSTVDISAAASVPRGNMVAGLVRERMREMFGCKLVGKYRVYVAEKDECGRTLPCTKRRHPQ